jgi:hypothetical protein
MHIKINELYVFRGWVKYLLAHVQCSVAQKLSIQACFNEPLFSFRDKGHNKVTVLTKFLNCAGKDIDLIFFYSAQVAICHA